MAWVVVYRAPVYKRPVLHQNEDVQFQSAANEPRDGFVARTLRDDPTNPRAYQLYYRQADALDVQSQSAVNEPRDGYPRVRPLLNPYKPRPQLYQWNAAWDNGPVVAEESTRPPWQIRPLLQPYRPQPWLFQHGTAQDIAGDEWPLSYVPSRLQQPYRARPGLYQQQAAWDSAPVVAADGGVSPWAPRFVYVAYRMRPALYWVPATDVVSAPPPAALPNLPMHWMRRLELLNLRVWG